MKRLLAVSWEMPPMYGPRATQVARTLGALASRGWQPTVVCLDPRRGGPNWRDGVDVAVPGGVETIRVTSPEEWAIVRALWRLMPSLRDRPDPKWVWVKRAAAAAATAAAQAAFDGLVTFAQPWSDHLVGLRVHRATKLPWVAHFSDPWVDSPYWRGSNTQRVAAGQMEADVIRHATAVVFVTEETADLVMRKYPDDWRRKVAVVPHGFQAGVPAVASAKAGPMRIVYTGRFYDGLRTPSALLRAIAALNAEQTMAGTLEVVLVGPFVTSFAAEATSLGLARMVRFHDKVSPADAQAMAAAADVLLVIDAPTDGPSPFLPSKLVDYLPLRKPIFGITPASGASAALITRLGGTIAAPGDNAGIRVALGDLVRRWREGELAVAPDFDRVAAEYDIRQTAARFSDVLTRAFAS
jgi:Glycosyl transferase 4-like domain